MLTFGRIVSIAVLKPQTTDPFHIKHRLEVLRLPCDALHASLLIAARDFCPGTKRALLRAALGLCCSSEVIEAFDRALGPLPPNQEEPFAVTQVPP